MDWMDFKMLLELFSKSAAHDSQNLRRHGGLKLASEFATDGGTLGGVDGPYPSMHQKGMGQLNLPVNPHAVIEG